MVEEVTLPYKRTQIGTLVLLVLVPPTLWVASLAARTGWHPVALFGLAVLLIALLAFHGLTVEVGREEIRVRAGFVPYTKIIPVAQVRGAERVRNPPTDLWGLRPIPGGWLLRVSGLDAVEVTTKDGTIYRIGTDRPDELLAAIEAARGQAAIRGDADVRDDASMR